MTKPLPSTSAVQQRVIRVFVSSTFRDMQAEREELVKRVFPQLRKLCEERGVTWGEVDLRWGVTDEQKSEGQVLPICLAEIRRCRPYFIGLLGERYGWVPDEFPPALLDDEGWLGERRGRSVTELEILQGVLNDSAMAEHAFFYFRSPACLDSLPPEQRPAFQESPAPEDIAQFGSEEAMRRAEERRHKLAALKERIRGSGLPVREDYPDPRALGESVLADLTSVIERVFPAGSAPEPLDREAADQETFARSRARVYIGRPDYFDRLDATRATMARRWSSSASRARESRHCWRTGPCAIARHVRTICWCSTSSAPRPRARTGPRCCGASSVNAIAASASPWTCPTSRMRCGRLSPTRCTGSRPGAGWC